MDRYTDNRKRQFSRLLAVAAAAVFGISLISSDNAEKKALAGLNIPAPIPGPGWTGGAGAGGEDPPPPQAGGVTKKTSPASASSP
jgi:hypothetical protein